MWGIQVDTLRTVGDLNWEWRPASRLVNAKKLGGEVGGGGKGVAGEWEFFKKIWFSGRQRDVRAPCRALFLLSCLAEL